MSKRAKKIIIAVILYIIAIIVKSQNELVGNIVFVISYIVVGLEIVRKAIRNISRGKVFDENFLMTVATIGAFGIGEFPEAVAVMVFYQIGELFQSFAVNKSRKSIATLMDIRPDYANLVSGDEIKKVSPEDVKIGNIIVVKPGEKIPLDGEIIEGESLIDTVKLTGEAVPRKAEIGDKVLSGGVNKNAVIKIKVEKEFGESTVSKILDLVENASSQKSKSENFITKFARYYTPIVVIMAVLLAFVPPILIKEATFSEWIYRALSFLVVSCPCALVVSIPLSFFGGIGRASKEGILIKGSNYLETLANTEIAVFDKTGTLTEGVFEVQEIVAEGISKDELLKYTAYVENFSTHPIAESIKKAYGKGIDSKLIKNIEEISGHGVIGDVEERQVIAGNAKIMDKYNIKYTKCEKVGTVVYVAVNEAFAGYILISDKIKTDAKTAIEELKKNGTRKTVMLTGDKKETGEYVAKEIGIDEVCTELLPNDKVEKLKVLLEEKSEKGKLVFAGDGINDAPVLALADIGIAMGGVRLRCCN